MIKAFLLSIILFIPSVIFAQQSPSQLEQHSLPGMNLRAIAKGETTTFVGEIGATQGLNNRIRSHIGLTSRYKVSRNFRLGLAYRGQKNHRNNENWVFGPAWSFNEETNDFENIVSPEFSIRFLLGDRTRLEWRPSYDFNLLFAQQTFRNRLILDYFFNKSAADHKAVYFKYEIGVPTNYARSELNEIWYYFGYRFALNEVHGLGFSLAFVEWVWTESNASLERQPQFQYRTEDRATLFTLNYLYSFDL